MSLIALAEAIDRLVESDQAFVVESSAAATLSELSLRSARELIALSDPLAWTLALFDSAGGTVPVDGNLDEDLAPFRMTLSKPESPDDELWLITNTAFKDWLVRGHAACRWHVARLGGAVVTPARVIQSWTGTSKPSTTWPAKSPRSVVKEYGHPRRVPVSILDWLCLPIEYEFFCQPATQVWVRAALSALVHCLPDEVDAESAALKFRGPPRLTLPKHRSDDDAPDHTTFHAVLDACRWVFEQEREAEMRHVLLANELARSGVPAVTTTAFLREHMTHARESAQLAYQMTLAETSRDTLRVLGDLRKSVTDETARLSDLSRQLTGAVAAATATGIGLIAARMAANAHPWLVAIIMLVVAGYIAMVIVSGVGFLRLQRDLRQDWHHRLYRFLPKVEYEKMVVKPAGKAEKSFTRSAWIGGMLIALLTAICLWTAWATSEPASTDGDSDPTGRVGPRAGPQYASGTASLPLAPPRWSPASHTFSLGGQPFFIGTGEMSRENRFEFDVQTFGY